MEGPTSGRRFGLNRTCSPDGGAICKGSSPRLMTGRPSFPSSASDSSARLMGRRFFRSFLFVCLFFFALIFAFHPSPCVGARPSSRVRFPANE